MAWLSRLPKRRVVSGLDLDEDDLPATSASGLCPKRDSRPSVASRHRRVIEEEKLSSQETVARTRALPAAVPPSEGPLPEERPERPATRQPPRVESAPRRRRNSSELSISEDQPASRNPESAAAPTPCRRRWTRRVKRRQAAREATEEAEHLIDVIGLSERPQEDESAPRRMAASTSQEPSSSWRSAAAETIEIPDTQPDPHELHEISESEDWSPAGLGRAVRLPPPMLWPSALREQPLPWRNEVALAARAATARMPARQGQPIPSHDLAFAQLIQMQMMQEVSFDLRRESERLFDHLTTVTRNIMSRQGLPDAIPELRQPWGGQRGGAAQMRRGLEAREPQAVPPLGECGPCWSHPQLIINCGL
ncbi:unnamed protein product [Cladocopium goreaui]|uniref:Uncharacterized protein n=1 Tax=Cladocopium goreaui TaxID=2562237 RepID=A0A9P1GDT4_9DINO|nr:unnamed protein product [Cladocopium goreaui]